MKHGHYLLPLMASLFVLSACNPDVPVPDAQKPSLAEVAAVPNGNDTTPDYTFSSTEAGTIIYGGSCTSSKTKVVKGSNTVTFASLEYGVYSNCTIRVKDAGENVSSTLAVNSFRVVRPKPINDTGVTLCGDMAYTYSGYTGSNIHNNNLDCATAGSTTAAAGTDSNGDAVPAGQDAAYGRDANPVTNSDDDGHKGFSFTKLKADGTALAIQNGTWSDAGSEAAGTKWSCVQDNVTGLIWEVKTNDNGLRDKDWTYSWYNIDSANNGGSAGVADGYGNCFTTTRCDTEKYVNDVNSATLCGANDWRLPTADELLMLASTDRTNPAIDVAFFPNTIASRYWSSLPEAGNFDGAWYVTFSAGAQLTFAKHNALSVRLVRGSQ